MKAAPLLVAALLACGAGQAQHVEQPRPFGYTVGDLVTQRVLLPEGFAPSPLPEASRVSAWLERRPARLERTPDGKRWLVVEYQVVNAPRALASVGVPAWQLAGSPPLHVAAATISVGPLAPPVAPGEALPLRPDRPAPQVDTASLRRVLRMWLAAIAATLLAWLAYGAWNAWRARTALPFGRALRAMRGQAATPAASHLALHEAFDRTAGQVVHAATLPALFARAPYLQSVQPQVEQFYAQSAALFFGEGLPAQAVSPQMLCRQLHRLERRHGP